MAADCVAFEVLAPPLDMHAKQPRRFDYAYSLVDEIQDREYPQALAYGPRSPLAEAVERLGRIASDVGSHDRDTALHALLKVRELQARV
jgi:hypothetical protein